MILPKVTPLSTPYTTDIRGYGELYEIQSVRRLQRHLKRLPPTPYFRYLFTLPNKAHNGKFGLTLADLTTLVTRYYNASIITSGFIDTPPWRSYRQSEVKDIHFLKRWCASIIFFFMVHFEHPSPSDSHMVYVVADTTKPIKVSPDIEDSIYWLD
jgi:hypothetical protein